LQQNVKVKVLLNSVLYYIIMRVVLRAHTCSTVKCMPIYSLNVL
jgi:hypothetical protein